MRLHDISQTYLKRVQAEFTRRHVDQPLHHKGRHRTANAAIRAHGRLAGRHAAHSPVIVFNAIRPRQEADHLHRLYASRPWINRIGADIANDLCGHAENPTRFVHSHLGIDNLIESLARGKQVFASIRAPFDRTANLAREDADQRFFGIERGLAAEAAADIGRDHPKVTSWNVKRLHKRILDDARHLRRRVQRHVAFRRLKFREAYATLKRKRRLAMNAKTRLDLNWWTPQRLNDIAALEFAFNKDVRCEPIMQQG